MYNGVVEPEIFAGITEDYHRLLETYGGEIPNEVYVEEYSGAKPIAGHFSQIFYEADTGVPLSVGELTPEEASEFYEVRRAYIDTELIGFQLLGSRMAQEKAAALNAEVTEPFYYASFAGWDVGAEYTHLLALLIALLCAMVAAPVFSSEYQTQADAILRTTKHGRLKLAGTKTGSTLLIALAMFGVCMGVFLGILCVTLGTDGLKSAFQFISVTAIVPLPIGEAQGFVLLSSFLSLLAVVCVTLWISAKVENPLTTLVCGLIMILLPTILRIGPDIGLLNWLSYCLPSSGVGITCGIFYEFTYRNTFLTVGDAAFWAPTVMLAAPVIWILISIPMTLHVYCRHQS